MSVRHSLMNQVSCNANLIYTRLKLHNDYHFLKCESTHINLLHIYFSLFILIYYFNLLQDRMVLALRLCNASKKIT